MLKVTVINRFRGGIVPLWQIEGNMRIVPLWQIEGNMRMLMYAMKVTKKAVVLMSVKALLIS